MIKVEQDMLVLDSSFTKEDVQAINEYVEIIKRQERERREAWLNRVRTWYQAKADIWYEGYETAEIRIVKMLEKQLAEQNVGIFYADAIRTSIKLIKEMEV